MRQDPESLILQLEFCQSGSLQMTCQAPFRHVSAAVSDQGLQVFLVGSQVLVVTSSASAARRLLSSTVSRCNCI